MQSSYGLKWITAVALAATCSLAACTSDSPPAGPPPPPDYSALIARAAKLQVTSGAMLVGPGTYAMPVGSSAHFTGRVTDSAGKDLGYVPVQWWITPWDRGAGAGTVDSLGNVTGQASGWLILHGLVGKAAEQAAIYVNEPAASIAPAADSMNIVVGSATTLSFTPKDRAGKTIEWGTPVTL